MLINTDLLKETADKILTAVDSDGTTTTEALELICCGGNLFMSVTNREYYLQVKLPITSEENLHVTVNANLFLKLISQTTTLDIELTQEGNNLIFKGNGTYKLPIIYGNNDVLTLPIIDIDNVTCQMKIENSKLQSISKYNSKELKKSGIALPVQRMYYMDEQGAITFGLGACVNNFTLEKPVKVLLNSKLVKLFKLFESTEVDFSLGYDKTIEDTIQTKVKFETPSIMLSSIIANDDTLLNQVPATAIRRVANNTYPYAIQLSKDELLQALNRISLFSEKDVKDEIKNYCFFEFHSDKIIIFDKNKQNCETVYYLNKDTGITETVTYKYDVSDFKYTIECYSEDYFTMNFGEVAAVLTYNNIKNIIPCIQSKRV